MAQDNNIPAKDSQFDTFQKLFVTGTTETPAVEPEPAPLRADPPALVTAKIAAAALGHDDAGAFHSFMFRHKELKRCSRQIGASVLWDLDKRRAEYDRKGWKPKHARQAAARQR